MRNNIFYIFLLIITLFGCQNFDYQSKGKDVPTQGKVFIGFDCEDSLAIQQWLEMFKHDYPKSNIIPIFTSATQIIDLLKKDSLSGAILNQSFNQQKLNWLLDKRNVSNRTVTLGFTSTAIIVNKANSLEKLKFIDLMNILNGNMNSGWHVVANFKGSCIMQLNDSVLKYTGKKIKYNPHFDVHCNSPQDIIENVKVNKNAIGIIPLNFISDKKDKLAVTNLQKIKVVALENPFYNDFYLPFQSQIAASQYPLIQPITAYDLQGYAGLMSGFVLYANSQTGQIILKKSGLYPANPPSRTIQIISE